MVAVDMIPNQEIKREQTVHGKPWETLHDGYFSDPGIAQPLLEQVLHYAAESGAATVVDLGGGTGTLSHLLTKQVPHCPFALINMDGSEEQLNAARANGVQTHCGVIESFRRNELEADIPLLYMMRSVLHYLNREALPDVLRHIREQTKPEEYFIHQTACFDSQEEADCLNELYALMHTEKRYPTEGQLVNLLEQSGWNVIEILPAPTLLLKENDLAVRYALSAEDLSAIRNQIPASHPECPHLFKIDESGFTAGLPYRIFVCKKS